MVSFTPFYKQFRCFVISLIILITYLLFFLYFLEEYENFRSIIIQNLELLTILNLKKAFILLISFHYHLIIFIFFLQFFN